MASQPQITFYGFPIGSRMNKIRIAAKFCGVQLKEEHITDRAQIKTAEYKATKHPLGKCPAIVTPQGNLFESNAILRYFARLNPEAKLYGSDAYTTSQVDQWLDFVSGEIDSQMWNTIYMLFGMNQRNDGLFNTAIKTLSDALVAVNAHLGNQTFLVGSSISIADIHLASSLIEPFRILFDEKERSAWPNLVRWFTTVTAQAPFAELYGTIRLCQKRFDMPPPAPAAGHEEHKKAEKKAEAPKKEEKPAAAKKEAEEGDEHAAEKKEKNPLDLLPPTTFDLYAFKTLFVNAPNKADAFEFLWKNLDKQGFSIWFIHYQKAEGENTKLFLTVNLSEGTCQKLEHFRKYAFGSWGVYGEEPNFEIKGCLLWRGVEHPQEVKDLGSYEYHTFVKANVDDEKDRKRVEEYWLSIGEGKVVDGLRARDVSYFK
jgi:elongation factor 1-gamma